MPDAPDAQPGLSESFARSLVALTGEAPADHRPVLAAVSGGPDSLALLLLLHETLGERTIAATVDHGLRAESAAEADHVARICAERGIAHAILRPPSPIIGNVQSEARRARYALLEAEADRVGAAWIATAHHADDQLETLLMRLARGSGVDGLAGIRARNGRVIRPLLALRKDDLLALWRAQGVEPVRDPSNDDPAFDRVRMRQALRGFEGVDPARAVRSAAALSEAVEALDWMTTHLGNTAIDRDGDALVLDVGGLPALMRRRLVLVCLARIEPGASPRGPALDRLLATLEAGRQATIGAVLCRGGKVWHFSAAPPRRA